MGLYNFQQRFEMLILEGTKTHTIRARRLHPDKPGNRLHLYVGLRHKGARLLMRPICTKVEEISLFAVGSVFIHEQRLQEDELELLARRDGFTSTAEMMGFWKTRFPFKGHVIHWAFPKNSEVR